MPWEASMALRAIDRGWRCGRFGTLGSPFRQALAAFTFQVKQKLDSSKKRKYKKQQIEEWRDPIL